MKFVLNFLLHFSFVFAQDDSFEQYNKIRQEMFEKFLKDDNDRFDNTALEILKKLQNSGMQIPENVFPYHKLNFSWGDNKLLIFPVNENDKIEMNIKNGVVAINGLSSKSRKKIKQSIPIIQKYLNYKNTKADFKDEKLIITFIN